MAANLTAKGIRQLYESMMEHSPFPVTEYPSGTLFGQPYPPLPELDYAGLINQIEKALRGEAMRKQRILLISETVEIIIGRIGLMLAERDPNFNSMEFYAKVKGRPE